MTSQEMQMVLNLFQMRNEMSKEDLMAAYSRLRPEARELFEALMNQGQEHVVRPDEDPLVGFESMRIYSSDEKYLENVKIEIIEEGDKLGKIVKIRNYGCGHSPMIYRHGGYCLTGKHHVCERCVRDCKYGHISCKRHVHEQENGDLICSECTPWKRFWGLSNLRDK